MPAIDFNSYPQMVDIKKENNVITAGTLCTKDWWENVLFAWILRITRHPSYQNFTPADIIQKFLSGDMVLPLSIRSTATHINGTIDSDNTKVFLTGSLVALSFENNTYIQYRGGWIDFGSGSTAVSAFTTKNAYKKLYVTIIKQDSIAAVHIIESAESPTIGGLTVPTMYSGKYYLAGTVLVQNNGTVGVAGAITVIHQTEISTIGLTQSSSQILVNQLPQQLDTLNIDGSTIEVINGIHHVYLNKLSNTLSESFIIGKDATADKILKLFFDEYQTFTVNNTTGALTIDGAVTLQDATTIKEQLTCEKDIIGQQDIHITQDAYITNNVEVSNSLKSKAITVLDPIENAYSSVEGERQTLRLWLPQTPQTSEWTKLKYSMYGLEATAGKIYGLTTARDLNAFGVDSTILVEWYKALAETKLCIAYFADGSPINQILDQDNTASSVYRISKTEHTMFQFMQVPVDFMLYGSTSDSTEQERIRPISVTRMAIYVPSKGVLYSWHMHGIVPFNTHDFLAVEGTSSNPSFSQIIVSGQSAIIPTTSEPLEIVAGTNVTLETNNTSIPKKLIINSTGGSGGTAAVAKLDFGDDIEIQHPLHADISANYANKQYISLNLDNAQVRPLRFSVNWSSVDYRRDTTLKILCWYPADCETYIRHLDHTKAIVSKTIRASGLGTRAWTEVTYSSKCIPNCSIYVTSWNASSNTEPIIDCSVNNLALTINTSKFGNAVKHSPADGTANFDAQFLKSKSILYFGTGMISIADNLGFNMYENNIASAFTIGFWCKPDSVTMYFGTSIDNTTGYRVYEKYESNEYRLYFGGIYDPNTSQYTEWYTGIVRLASEKVDNYYPWYYFEFTFDGTTLRAYKNGILCASKAIRNIIYTNTGFYIGGHPSYTTYSGYLTDFFVLKGIALHTGSSYTLPTYPRRLLDVPLSTSSVAYYHELEGVSDIEISTSVARDISIAQIQLYDEASRQTYMWKPYPALYGTKVDLLKQDFDTEAIVGMGRLFFTRNSDGTPSLRLRDDTGTLYAVTLTAI